MSKFDAAIDSIRGYLRVMEAYSSKHEKDISESYAAIRVLEAAGKVDKGWAENFFKEVAGPCVKEGVGRDISDLLAALPDKEE